MDRDEPGSKETAVQRCESLGSLVTFFTAGTQVCRGFKSTVSWRQGRTAWQRGTAEEKELMAWQGESRETDQGRREETHFQGMPHLLQ